MFDPTEPKCWILLALVGKGGVVVTHKKREGGKGILHVGPGVCVTAVQIFECVKVRPSYVRCSLSKGT